MLAMNHFSVRCNVKGISCLIPSEFLSYVIYNEHVARAASMDEPRS